MSYLTQTSEQIHYIPLIIMVRLKLELDFLLQAF